MRKIKFITGPAGTGKSFKLREALKVETRRHLICAPTGIAAINIGGSTAHRTFKINTNNGFVGKKWYEIEVVYIDEASMMGAKLFESIIVGAPNADFVLVGDMAQLPPVKDKYWFETPYINQFDIEVERLTEQFRQADCPELSNPLNKIRNGTINTTELRQLYSASCHPDDNKKATVLAYRNDTVRAINAEKLLAIKGDMYESEAVYSGAMKPQDCKAEKWLQIKEGAEIVMLNNDIDGRWQNGTRGKVLIIHQKGTESLFSGMTMNEDDIITVQIGKDMFDVRRHDWTLKAPIEITPARREELERELEFGDPINREEIRHWLATGIEYAVIGTCKQFPMKLAYALTVHKSQGMTLDKVHVITSGFAGCYGIGYVALSRARSLEWLSLDRKPTPNDFKFDQRIKNYV